MNTGTTTPDFAIAGRVRQLGTETAFAVSEEAAALAASGKTVYPFHLGDLNIPTPDRIVEAATKAMRDGRTTYCPTAGIPQLREALADDVGRARGVDYTSANVSIQPGGKPVIAKFLLAAMNAGDEVLYPNPGFPIYSSLIEFLGGVAVPYGYREESDGFHIDLSSLEDRITAKARVLILNDLHNPTAAECTVGELECLAELALKHGLVVLCDEAYFDVRFDGVSRSLASLPGMRNRCVLLYTFSKKYAMTGWRLGAAVGPAPLIDVITRLNVNIESCTNHFAQYGALEALTGDPDEPHRLMETLRARRDAAWVLLNAIDGVECHRPNTTFYLYPNVTEAVRRVGCASHEGFRRAMLDATGVSTCTRLHFGPALSGETQYYLRFAYAGVGIEQIEEGLGKLKAFIDSEGRKS